MPIAMGPPPGAMGPGGQPVMSMGQPSVSMGQPVVSMGQNFGPHTTVYHQNVPNQQQFHHQRQVQMQGNWNYCISLNSIGETKIFDIFRLEDFKNLCTDFDHVLEKNKETIQGSLLIKEIRHVF